MTPFDPHPAPRRLTCIRSDNALPEEGSPAMAAEPFEVSVAEVEIADLRARLRRTRWPEPEPVDDWSQGIPLAYVQELCRSWAEDQRLQRRVLRQGEGGVTTTTPRRG